MLSTLKQALQYAYHHLTDDHLTGRELVDRLDALVQQQGLKMVQAPLSNNHTRAQSLEMAAARNRLRPLRIGRP